MIRSMLIGTFLAALGPGMVAAQEPASQPAQQVFATPRAAVDALLAACKDNDSAALIRMLGAQYGEKLKKIDDAEERQPRLAFHAKARSEERR